jgi:hypothetical protein
MNSRKAPTDDPFDVYIAFRLRHWLAQMPPPPAWGKSRLLRGAVLLQLQRSEDRSLWGLILRYTYFIFEYISYMIAYERPNHDLEMGLKLQFFSTSAREDIMRTYTARMALFGFIS